MKHIIVDADDTILDYTSKLLHYGNIPTPISSTYSDICEYLTSSHNFSYSDVQDLIVDFNNSEEFRTLEPLKGSENIIRKLNNEGIELHIITSCGDSRVTERNRRYNIREVFGDAFKQVHVLPLLSSKYDILKQYSDNDVVFVEDTIGHYNDAKSLGIDSYIIKGQMNNRAHNVDVNTFSHWDEFYDIYISNHK